MNTVLKSASPLLTIAIPTYNRLDILLETLERLACQNGFHNEDLEIVVSDNASSQDPTVMLRAFEKRHQRSLVIHRNATNEGIDGNIHRVTELARGRFVLLMSDDDVLLPGALEYLRQMVAKQPDLLFCFVNATQFWGDYKGPLTNESAVVNVSETILTNSADKFIEAVGVWATFVSSFFFRREAWVAVAERERYIGTDIYLTHILYRLLALHPEQKKIITKECLVAARMEYTGNFRIIYAFAQQFMQLLCVDAVKLGFEKKALRAVKLRTIRISLPIMVLMVRRTHPKQRLSLREFSMLLQYIWWEPSAWLTIVPVAVLPLNTINRLTVLRRNILQLAWRLIKR